MLINVDSDISDEHVIYANSDVSIGVRPFFGEGNHNEITLTTLGDGTFRVGIRSQDRDGVYKNRELVSGSLHGCWIWADDGHNRVYV